MFKHACTIIGLFGIIIYLTSCNTSKIPVDNPPDINDTWITINDNAIATNDTALWVKVTGLDIDSMKLSDNIDLVDIPYIHFDTLTLIITPRIEGVYTIYGIFKSPSGKESDIKSDDIILDFTANISRLEVVAEKDTLLPGDWIEFSIVTGESGVATIKLGSLFQKLKLRPESDGVYNDILIIPPIVKHEDAGVIATFTDIAGNVATFEHDKTYPIRGPELNPRVISRVALGDGGANDIWFHRGKCFVSAFEKIHILNVLNKNSPEYLDPITSDAYNEGIIGNGEFLLVTDLVFGLSIYNLQNPNQPERLGRARVWGNAKDVVVNDKFAYVSSELNGLFIISLISPANLELIERLPINCTGESICLNDSIVYIGGTNGIAIVSIADPFNPRILSQYNEFEGDVTELIYHEGNLLLATRNSGLIRVNVEDPTNPIFVQEFERLNHCTDLFVKGPFLFLTRDDKLTIINITNINELPIMEEVTDLDFAKSLYVDQGLVYVTEFDSLAVIELTQPPQLH